MDHEEIAETYGFMNSANGVLIVADHMFIPATPSSWSTNSVMPADDCRFRALTIKPPPDFFNFKSKELAKIPKRAEITAFGSRISFVLTHI